MMSKKNPLENDYDIIVIDTPSINEAVDALIFNESMSCYCLLVLEVGNTRYDSIDAFYQEYKDTSSAYAGAVVNKVRSCEVNSPRKFDDLLEMCMRLPIQIIKRAFH